MINISKPTGNQQRETKTQYHVIEGFNPRAWLKVKNREIEEWSRRKTAETAEHLQKDCQDSSSIQISRIWQTCREGGQALIMTTSDYISVRTCRIIHFMSAKHFKRQATPPASAQTNTDPLLWINHNHLLHHHENWAWLELLFSLDWSKHRAVP